MPDRQDECNNILRFIDNKLRNVVIIFLEDHTTVFFIFFFILCIVNEKLVLRLYCYMSFYYNVGN